MARTATTSGARPALKLTEFVPGSSKEAMKEAGATTRTVHMVPIQYIHVAPGFNLRVTDTPEYKEKLDELKRSIIQEGFYGTKPLAGFVSKLDDGSNVIYVTDGHRRLEAAKMAAEAGAEIEKLPVILKEPKTEAVDLAVALHRENTGEPLTMLEKAVLVKRLLNAGMSEKEVASKLGMTERYVSDLMVLVNAPKPIRALVSTGRVSGTEAVKQMRKAGAEVSKATEKLSAAAEKAEAKGKKRATAADTGSIAPSVKMQTAVTRHALSVGQVVHWDEIKALAALLGDTDWYRMTDAENEVEITEPVEVTLKVRRPKKDEPAAEAEDEAPAEPKKRGRKAKAEVDEPVGVEVDPMTMEDVDAGDGEGELEGAADLQQLGIADPAAGL